MDTNDNRTNAQNRLDRWTQKMLDFSARNRLLNIPKTSRQVLPLLCSDVHGLEDQIAANEIITIRSLADAIGEKQFDDLVNGKCPKDKYDNVVSVELSHHRLCAMMAPKDVHRRLTDLYHDARTELEESGVNTLFLAVGALQWTEPGTGANRKSYRAPVLMVPVRLERATMAEGVKMVRLDEDTTINTTLVEFLRAQFGVVLQGLDPLPTDDSGVDVPKVLKTLREAVRDREGWDVLEEACVGCFSFGKFVMWKDLTERADELRKNPLVDHLIGAGGLYDDGIKVFPADEVSEHIRPGELFCPVSYDSSQLTAVLYSALGKTFVLHGPPGTGKSQTITNVIAHNLALGRRVLFVSEKKAALDVVKNRLDRIGLSPFCLELHSNKTEKKRFYEQLREALAVETPSVPRDWDRVVDEFGRKRAELNDYIAELHRPYPNGLTAYHCFSRAIRRTEKPRPELVAADPLTQDRASYLDARQVLQELATAARGVSPRALRTLPVLKAETWSPALERELREAAENLAAASEGLDLAPGRLYRTLTDLDRRDELGAKLDCYALDNLAKFSLDGVAQMLAENAKAFVLFRFFKNLVLFGEIKALFKPGAKKPSAAKLAADLPLLKEYHEAAKRIVSAEAEKIAAKRDELRPRLAALTALADGASLPESGITAADYFRGTAESAGEIRGVLHYQKTCARAAELGVGAFGRFLADNEGADLLETFEDAYAAKMLEKVVAQSPVLSSFTGPAQEERIERFRELDAKYTELSKKVVFARLAANLQKHVTGPSTKGTELGLVRRECEKKMRHKAVRTALVEAKSLIPALKPCFLMSPLSVAQYLPVDAEPFDLVVFDEASQIPVWDAIGVIARARQLVVVGDPKQMPPTNFFQKGEAEDEDAEDETVEDQESILDECLVAGVHSTYLNWHYRSRHESLIAFSNAHYYEGRLCTFPAAVDSPRLGVKFMFVENGRFVREGSGPRTNPAEAKALVDYVCSEVKKPGYKPRSIGVVTFSMPQQKLIQTMLEERRSADAALEKLLPEEGEGAYFVKNLENVQGDESDVILFSVGYAPDENGRFTMNFGPLNLSGGERRLNVAVTRAKEQVVVFSSIRGAQIDAGEGGRTKAVGASHLKAFLEYAERGTAGRSGVAADAANGGFGDVVSAFLTEKGYQVDRDVGCSDYRIDVAVRDPYEPGRYLMGVECDGPSYAGQRTAQDRDVNRAGVLKGLGWHTCRVWSVDWAFDRKHAEEHLLRLLDEARKGRKA